jgi:anti-anti-sigma factor
MQSKTTIKTELKGSIGIISLSGDITDELEQTLLNAYHELTKSGASKILLKFIDSCFINSSGIAVIILVVSQAKDARQSVGAVGLSLHFQKIFEMIGLIDYLTIFQGEDAAMKLL